MRTRCWTPWACPTPRAVALALLGVVALLPHGATTARAEVPFPTCASVGCADPYDYGAYLKNDPANVLDPPSPEERVPNDFNPASGEAWKFLSETGLNIVEAWGLTTGRPDVVIAVLDSGILWAAPDVRNKAALNTDELPVPVGCPDPVSPSQLPHDCNGDGVVNVVDFAGQVCPGGPVADANGNGALDAQDLILLCSDGVDGVAGAAAPVANGYIDDISGWDFHEDDNDPFDDVDAGHGTGQAHDSTAEAHNFGGFPGVAPSAMFLPLRVGDHFVAVGQDFARAVVYATDWRVSVIQEALGAVSQSPVGQAAVDYAYANGVPIIASAADEESRHHNYPANFEHTIWVNSIRDGDGTLAEAPDPQRYDLLNGCTNYGGRAWIAISSASCSSEATGRGAGVAGLLVSHGKNLVDAGAIEAWDALLGIPYSAEEVRQIFRASAEDIDYEGNLELDIDSLISTFLSGPTPETAFGSSRFPTQAGWDQFTGFGRPDTVRMLDIAENAIPPEADLSGGPRWFDVIDPDETPSVELRGSASAWRVDGFVNVSIQAGCGVQPTAFDELDTLVAVAGLDAALLTVWDPAATAAACGFDPAEPIEDPDAHAVTLRMVVTDRLGRRGEDRRTVAIHSDPTLRFPPRHLGASGEASPALVDVRRDGKLEIVYGTGGGALHVLNGRKGKDLPGFPVYTDPIPVHDSPAYDSGAVPIPREPIIAGVAADDLDGDGEIEIVAASAEGKLYVWDAHGNRRAGFPVATDPALSLPEDRDRFNDADVGIFAAPTLADLDGQPGLEILVAAADGHLYAWHDDGSEVEGFPVRVADPERVDLDPVTGKATPIAGQDVRTRGRKLIGSPAVGDLDGDGTPEIIATSNEEYGDGDGFGTNSVLLQILLQGVVEIGDEFDLDTTGRVYAIHADGNAHDGGPFVDGWPVAVPMLVSGLLPNVATGIPGAPALADLDPTDGDNSLVVAIFSAAGPAMLYGPDGSPLLGVDLFGKFNSLAADFPGGGFAVTVPDSVGSADGPFFPALGSGAFGDLDGDGLPEYAAPTVGIRKLIDVAAPGLQSFGDHQMTVWDPRSGELFGPADEPVFPVFMDDMQFLSSPSITDVDGDGRAEVVNGSGAYLIRAYRFDGTMPEGWPKFTHGWMISSPTVGDVDGDGLFEVVVLTREGNFFVWDTPAPAAAGAQQWQGFGRDRRNSGNWSADVPLGPAPSTVEDSLLWDLESLLQDLPDEGAGDAQAALRTGILALEEGVLRVASQSLPAIELGLAALDSDPEKLHRRSVRMARRAARRAVGAVDCAPDDDRCKRKLRNARKRIRAGDQAFDADVDSLAVLNWARALGKVAPWLR